MTEPRKMVDLLSRQDASGTRLLSPVPYLPGCPRCERQRRNAKRMAQQTSGHPGTGLASIPETAPGERDNAGRAQDAPSARFQQTSGAISAQSRSTQGRRPEPSGRDPGEAALTSGVGKHADRLNPAPARAPAEPAPNYDADGEEWPF